MTPPMALTPGAGCASWSCRWLSQQVSSFPDTPGWAGALGQVPSCRRNLVRPGLGRAGDGATLCRCRVLSAGLEQGQCRQEPGPQRCRVSSLLLPMFHTHQGPYGAFTPNLPQPVPVLHQHQAGSPQGLLGRAILGQAGVHRASIPPPPARASSIKFQQDPHHLEIF